MDDFKNDTLAFKVTTQQKAAIQAQAKEQGTSVSAFVRDAVLNRNPFDVETTQHLVEWGFTDKQFAEACNGILAAACIQATIKRRGIDLQPNKALIIIALGQLLGIDEELLFQKVEEQEMLFTP